MALVEYILIFSDCFSSMDVIMMTNVALILCEAFELVGCAIY